MDLKNVTIAILAGGLGTRLRSKIPYKQKVLAKIGNYPFLEYLLNQLNETGFRKAVICTGYLGNQIQDRFGKKFRNLSLDYSQEKSRLDTAGAIRLALPVLKSENILVTNGDSFFDTDLKKLFEFHLQRKSKATILLTRISDTSRYGTVKVDKNGTIVAFQEKIGNGEAGLINTGIYLFQKSRLHEIPEERAVSFEKEMFPRWVGEDFYGFKGQGKFIDIGTPESYKEAEEFFSQYPI